MSDETEELETKAEKVPASNAGPSDPLLLSAVGLVGDITEETANDVMFSLLMLHEKQTSDYLSMVLEMNADDLNNLSEKELQDLKPNIDFYISTNGGNADEMFGIYDMMRKIKDTGVASVSAYGLGKVMSAGVLLLASGTKGKRYVGKHCRIMIHSVIGGSSGPMHQLENEFAEVKKIQDGYIQALVNESSMTEKQLRKLLKRKTNIYLSAEEAVELGIADEVF